VTLSFAFLEDTGTPTAEAAFEFEQNPAGVEIVPKALGQPVTVQLDGRDVATLESEDVGVPTLLPTAPGDEITVVSRDEERSVLLRERVDDRAEVGDFIVFYDFESQSGTTVVDQSRNDNDGEFRDDGGGSGPDWVRTADGSCLSFNGENDHVQVDDITTAGVDSVEEFTVATQVRITGETGSGTNARQQFVEHTFGGNEWFLETADSDAPFEAIYAVNYSSDTVSSGERLEVGETYVIVGTYDGDSGDYDLYIDGTKVASANHDREVGMGELRLGRDFESKIQYLDGRLCEFRLYYTSFDSAKIQSLTDTMAAD
jgi:hypothetical protein